MTATFDELVVRVGRVENQVDDLRYEMRRAAERATSAPAVEDSVTCRRADGERCADAEFWERELDGTSARAAEASGAGEGEEKSE